MPSTGISWKGTVKPSKYRHRFNQLTYLIGQITNAVSPSDNVMLLQPPVKKKLVGRILISKRLLGIPPSPKSVEKINTDFIDDLFNELYPEEKRNNQFKKIFNNYAQLDTAIVSGSKISTINDDYPSSLGFNVLETYKLPDEPSKNPHWLCEVNLGSEYSEDSAFATYDYIIDIGYYSYRYNARAYIFYLFDYMHRYLSNQIEWSTYNPKIIGDIDEKTLYEETLSLAVYEIVNKMLYVEMRDNNIHHSNEVSETQHIDKMLLKIAPILSDAHQRYARIETSIKERKLNNKT